AGHLQGLHAFRSFRSLFLGQSNRTDYRMRTYIGTSVALDTVVRIPNRNIYRDTALLVCGGAGGSGTVHVILECGYRKEASFLSAYLALDVVYDINNVRSAALRVGHLQAFIFCVLPAFRNLNLNYLFCSLVDGCPVLLNHIVALAAVGSLRGSLHQLDSLLLGNDVGQLEESGLQNGVDTGGAHAGLDTDLHTVDGVELNIVVGDIGFLDR